MKGFIKKAILTVGGAGALAVAIGCDNRVTNYREELVDPCYPDRYMCAARRCVNDSIAPQVQNGHVLDQTIWDYHFQPNTATLTYGARMHLDYIARRRPYPDTMVYVQTAQNVPLADQAKPEEMTRKRAELDGQRVAAVQNYLNTVGAARGATFQVAVHDPGDPSISAIPAGEAIIQMYGSSSGTVFGGGASGSGTNVTGGGGGGGNSGGGAIRGGTGATPPTGSSGGTGGGGY